MGRAAEVVKYRATSTPEQDGLGSSTVLFPWSVFYPQNCWRQQWEALRKEGFSFAEARAKLSSVKALQRWVGLALVLGGWAIWLYLVWMVAGMALDWAIRHEPAWRGSGDFVAMTVVMGCFAGFGCLLRYLGRRLEEDAAALQGEDAGMRPLWPLLISCAGMVLLGMLVSRFAPGGLQRLRAADQPLRILQAGVVLSWLIRWTPRLGDRRRWLQVAALAGSVVVFTLVVLRPQ
jgi:hypothetical protein